MDMIRSFAGRETGHVWQGIRPKRSPPDFLRTALRKLQMIAAARRIEDLRVPPGNRLELLEGGRAGQWSICVNNQWRICFKWVSEHAEDVEICDYH